MALSKCPKCSGHIIEVKRADQSAFLFCRACKLPFAENGRIVIDTRNLNSSFNPTRLARSITGKSMRDLSPVARTAIEAFIIASFHEVYTAGMKDGILLAYSQDVEEGVPLDEVHKGV